MASYSSSAGSHEDLSPHAHGNSGSHQSASILASSPGQFHSSLAHMAPLPVMSPQLASRRASRGELSDTTPEKRSPSSKFTSDAKAADERSAGLNPFSFHVAADAQALKNMSHNSYARRRWLHVNQISEQAESASSERLEGELSVAVYSNSSVLQQLEHQWTSLSEPAVLPLTTDPTSEHMQASATSHRPVPFGRSRSRRTLLW